MDDAIGRVAAREAGVARGRDHAGGELGDKVRPGAEGAVACLRAAY